MHHKLTITVDEQVYKGLHAVIGRGNISRFLESLARPYLTKNDFKEYDDEVRAMAADTSREAEAEEWCEALIEDSHDEKR